MSGRLLKIHGNKTRQTDGPALCLTCRYAGIVRGARFGDDFIRCGAFSAPITFHVTECSSYNDSRLIPLHELQETAWVWMSNRFVSPSELMRIEMQKESSAS